MASFPEAGDRPIYSIVNADGITIGVRKISTSLEQRAFQFLATQREAAAYTSLMTQSDWQKHIVPIRSILQNRNTVILDFDWLDGVTIEQYLAIRRDWVDKIFSRIARQLIWLARAGYVHGDIKLDNFFLKKDGTPLILDLGRTVPLINPPQINAERTEFLYMIRPYFGPARLRTLEAFSFVPRAGQTPADRLIEFYTEATRVLRAQKGPSRVTRRYRRNVLTLKK